MVSVALSALVAALLAVVLTAALRRHHPRLTPTRRGPQSRRVVLTYTVCTTVVLRTPPHQRSPLSSICGEIRLKIPRIRP
jgi:hypothetical protein